MERSHGSRSEQGRHLADSVLGMVRDTALRARELDRQWLALEDRDDVGEHLPPGFDPLED